MTRLSFRSVLAALLLAGAERPAPAQQPPLSPPSRIRLFRFQPGFLSELPWLEDDRPPDDPRLPEPEDDGGPDWISVAAGNDNPYFDFRQRGDPGGVGFARVNTQVQLFDTERTAFALALQAVTPLGLENEGVADNQGPTVVTPALSIFHSLTDATAVQAFVGKNLPLMNSAGRPVSRHVHYGLALQRPVSTEASDPLSSLYLSVGALGQMGREKEGPRREPAWEVLPGLYWKAAETWWLSAGYALPVGPVRTDTGARWQLTCSWQF